MFLLYGIKKNFDAENELVFLQTNKQKYVRWIYLDVRDSN